MSSPQLVVCVDCPACRWPKAVLAYENSRKQVFLCPHCQFLWDTTERDYEERASLARRRTKLRETHGHLEKKHFAHAKK
jgi:transposase-like protein